jgi:ATP-binding cassette subfamily B protein
MDAGRIVERGTHRELLAKGAAYAEMWALQQQEEEAVRGGTEIKRDLEVAVR